MRWIKNLIGVIVFCILTITTQIGGLVYLVTIVSSKKSDQWTSNRLMQTVIRINIFITLYLISTFILVPTIAKPFGRVPLPYKEINHLRPLNIFTCLMNRNYVRPDLKEVALDVAQKINNKFPGSIVNYLDANFPFFDNFPLIPHLSHCDGKKLDFAFFYLSATDKRRTNDCPSIIGYGICEEALTDEVNTPNVCGNKGYWQYSFLTKIIPQYNKENFIFDEDRTKELVYLLTSNSSISKLFIEPHLKSRLKLNSDKIKFHGCHAVRHDDHIHVQIN